MTIIQRFRQIYGKTQMELAEELGIVSAVSSISGAECGEYVKPGLRRKLSIFYGLSEDDLFDSDGFARDISVL